MPQSGSPRGERLSSLVHPHIKRRPTLKGTLVFWCVALFFCGFVSASEPSKPPRYLDIITSFPPEFYAPFVTAFSQKYPDIQVFTLNKKATAALAEIKRGNPHRCDLFWSSSSDAFALLKAADMLARVPGGRRHPALSIDGVNLDDPDGYFWGFALSAVGWMWNPAYLQKEGLPVPGSWEDLTDPIYYGHLAMSTPSRSGTTHLVVESLLQERGWEKGWAMLLQMAGNLRTVSARSFSVPEGLLNERFGLGLGIDFLAQSRNALRFRYGVPAYLVPAGIAMLKAGNNPKEAALFIDFILSPEGQEILLAPSVSRLPVSRELYARKGLTEPELFTLIRKKQFKPYDAQFSLSRYHLVNQLFDRMITYRLTERRSLWKRFLAIKKQAGNDWPGEKDVSLLLGEVPVTEAQGLDSAYNASFTLSARGPVRNGAYRKEIERWEAFVSQRLARASALLKKAESDLGRCRP